MTLELHVQKLYPAELQGVLAVKSLTQQVSESPQLLLAALTSPNALLCTPLQVMTALSYERLVEPRVVQCGQSSDSGG